VVTATPNPTTTWEVLVSATAYATRVIASATAFQMTATAWTPTPTPSPTVDLTRVSATPTPLPGVSAQGQPAVVNDTPPATCTPTRPASWPGWVAYTIRGGDTLSGLAAATGTDTATIMSANCLTSTTIIVGTTLYLPKQPPVQDSDNDGAPDDQDTGPNQAGPASNNYCPSGPDGDGDGAPDDQDSCPNQAGPASNNYCPLVAPNDRDGDGAPDDQDPCPDEAGPASNNYCPLVSPTPAGITVTINSVNGLTYVPGVGCQANVSITVSGGSGSVQGQFRVRHINYDDTYPVDTFTSGTKQVTLGGRNPGEKNHDVWITFSGGSSNTATGSCAGFPYPE
jgi:LysM repeat protein